MAEPLTALLQGKRGSRIRQGTPQEENALAQHLMQLAPSQQRTSEAGQLGEVLVLLGQLHTAAVLQQSLSELIKEQGRAAAWVRCNPPPGSPGEVAGAPTVIDASNGWKWAILRGQGGLAAPDGSARTEPSLPRA